MFGCNPDNSRVITMWPRSIKHHEDERSPNEETTPDERLSQRRTSCSGSYGENVERETVAPYESDELDQVNKHVSQDEMKSAAGDECHDNASSIMQEKCEEARFETNTAGKPTEFDPSKRCSSPNLIKVKKLISLDDRARSLDCNLGTSDDHVPVRPPRVKRQQRKQSALPVPVTYEELQQQQQSTRPLTSSTILIADTPTPSHSAAATASEAAPMSENKAPLEQEATKIDCERMSASVLNPNQPGQINEIVRETNERKPEAAALQQAANPGQTSGTVLSFFSKLIGKLRSEKGSQLSGMPAAQSAVLGLVAGFCIRSERLYLFRVLPLNSSSSNSIKFP